MAAPKTFFLTFFRIQLLHGSYGQLKVARKNQCPATDPFALTETPSRRQPKHRNTETPPIHFPPRRGQVRR